MKEDMNYQKKCRLLKIQSSIVNRLEKKLRLMVREAKWGPEKDRMFKVINFGRKQGEPDERVPDAP